MKAEMYRGWEIHHSTDANAIWAGYEYDAYFGGVDLDAPRVNGRTLDEVKAEIDDHDLTEPAGPDWYERRDELQVLGFIAVAATGIHLRRANQLKLNRQA